MKFLASVEEKIRRLEELETELQNPDITKDLDRFRSLSKESSELRRIRDVYEAFTAVEKALTDARHLAEQGNESEFKEMAEAEVKSLSERRHEILGELESLLIKRDPVLSKNAVIEIRAGTGGAEASLFASDVFRMFQRYAASKGFKVELLSQQLTEAGGVREVIFSVNGEGAYGRFKFESGVHRVQRVPATEASGRIHTSAVTVAVFPEVEDVEVNIRPDEIRVDVFRSGGPGGQSVNTTDSAVRVTHVPTGLIVKCQDEKSQLKNKLKAMKILRARLYDLHRNQTESQMAEQRKQQIGSGDRSEKIRTYNFNENRVTDHRIGLTIHNLDGILDGDLDPLVEALIEKDETP